MVRLNHHFSKLQGSYLFPEIEKKIASYRAKHPDCRLSDLGIGDITQPLPSSVIKALCAASREMGEMATFRGYGPSEGYAFLREAIALNEYGNLGISPDEIFISDGAQSDIANFQELFASDNRIGIPDPTYPVYLDSNVMAGRTKAPLKTGKYGGVTYLPCTEENNFKPKIPSTPLDLIYLCFPSNPTGAVIDRSLMKEWVEFAKANRAIILLDGAYASFVTSPDTPKSIYEIEGADEVAVEFRSFSKSAGFTGLRCSYTVVPRKLQIFDCGSSHSVHALWKRRQDTKFNGVAYPIQKAAEAVFSPEGKKEVQEMISSCLNRALSLRQGLIDLGFTVFGGTNAPYLWCKTPTGRTSWEFFDDLLEAYQIVSVPGKGFGHAGEGYVRLSAFADEISVTQALSKLKSRT